MPESFGDYKVLEQIGTGAHAEVFRARDTRAGRTTAIKVLTADVAMDPVQGRPFADEAFLAKTLGHPNAATLYDIGEQGGRPHLVYEFVQGQTLEALLAGKPIHPRRALEFATQIADALADAHALGLVHRALRPDTVMISTRGNAKILDFGLGHYATAVASLIAETGASVPAMRYWAPEQRRGDVDARSDIYSLGLLLVEMLMGKVPQADGRPPDVSMVPTAIQPVLNRMLIDDPTRRVDAAATVAAELRQLTATLDAQRDASTPPSPAPAEGTPAARVPRTSPPPGARPAEAPKPARATPASRRSLPPAASTIPTKAAAGPASTDAVASASTVVVAIAVVLAVLIWWFAV
jgi:serine/threonine protein kinase